MLEKFRKGIWGKELGRKKKYYVQEFIPTCDLQPKEYIGASISWRAKILIAQLSINFSGKRDDGKDLKKFGKNWCVLFALLGQWNQKNISFWNVTFSKTPGTETVTTIC